MLLLLLLLLLQAQATLLRVLAMSAQMVTPWVAAPAAARQQLQPWWA